MQLKPLVAWLLLSCFVVAEERVPRPVINGPRTARSGDLIILDAGESDADHFDWLVDTSDVSAPAHANREEALRMAGMLQRMGWKLASPADGDTPTHAIRNDGKELFLSSYPGTYRVSLAVSVDGVGVRQTPWTVIVSGAPETPIPDPPPAPPSEFGLAPKVPVWLATVPAAARINRIAVSAAMNDVAKSAESGSFRTITEMQMASSVVIGAAITDRPAWAQFVRAFGDALKQLEDEGKVKTPQDAARAFREVAGAM